MSLDGTIVRDEYHSLVRKDVLELVPSGQKKILDVGGGTGASAAYLKSIGKAEKATIVDLVGDNCLPEIDNSYGGNLEDPELLEKISKENGPYDVILCLDVLEHLTDPWGVVDRLSAMLSPGGCFVVSVPNVRNYKLVVPLVFQGKFELKDRGLMDRTHLRWFVEDTAKELMKRPGLEIDHFHKHFDGQKKLLFNKLTLGLLREFLTIQFYIRAVKK